MKHEHTFRCSDCGVEIGHTCNAVPKPKAPESPCNGRNGGPVVAIRRQKPCAPAHTPARADLPTLSLRDTIVDSISLTGVTLSMSELVSPENTPVHTPEIPISHYIVRESNSGTAMQSSFIAPPEPPSLAVPEKLAEFDRIMRRSRKYRPTERFYERIMAKYGDVPYLDFAEQAEEMITWLRANRKRYDQLTDICQFASKWLVRAADDAWKVGRANGVYRPAKGTKSLQSGAQSLRMGGKLSADQDASVSRMEREARRHYEE